MNGKESDQESVMYALDVIEQINSLLATLLVVEAGCNGVYYCVQAAWPFSYEICH